MEIMLGSRRIVMFPALVLATGLLLSACESTSKQDIGTALGTAVGGALTRIE